MNHGLDDGLDDHPDLAGLGWSKRDERRALKRARSPRPAGTFLRRHRVKVISVGGVIALAAAGVVLISGIDRSPAAGGPAVDLERPFLGTPVEQWAEGAAGIVAPEPVAVGEYTAEEVATSYAAVRQLLITARLDRAVIVEQDVEPYLRLLDPQAQVQVRDIIAQGPAGGAGYVTRISRGFHLLPAQPRVRGRMTAELDREGALLVRTDYVVAYAFHTDEPDQLLNPMDIVVVERVATDVIVSVDRGLWPRPIQGYAYSAACTPYDTGLLAPAYSEPVVSDAHAGHAEDRERMFDPNLPMPTSDGCAE